MEPNDERADAVDLGIPGADADRIAVKGTVAVTRPGRHRRIGARARWWEEGHRVIGGAQHQELAGFGRLALVPDEGVDHQEIFVVRRVLEPQFVVTPDAATRNRIEIEDGLLSPAPHM